MVSLLLLSAAVLATSASADQALILSKSPSPLWHPTGSSVAFSASAMADLALNSMGLATGRISSRSAAPSPVQADLFTHSEAYALLLLADAPLAALDAALGGAQAFHELYPTTPINAKVPVAVAQQVKAKYPQGIRCAGSEALCAGVQAQSPVAPDLVQKVLNGNAFLSASDEQDVAFARELAQVLQLTAELEENPNKVLYIVGISGLQGEKKLKAQQAVATTVTEFLAQLMKTEKMVAAQVMQGQLPTSVKQVAAMARKLASGLDGDEEEEEVEEEEEEEEEEYEDLEAESGSVWEDDDNSTTTTNTTAPGAVSMPDIAEYQIILWTSVLLGAMLLMAVLAMANMDAGRDSLLYAKFIADVNGRKTN